MTFISDKCSDAQTDVTQHRAQSSTLGAFNQALLFQRPMVHLDSPRRERKVFPLRFAHLFKTRRPIFRCAVCRANPKYFDPSETFEPTNSSIDARQSGFRDGLQSALVDSDLPICFEPRQKMPAQRGRLSDRVAALFKSVARIR